ncbi:MAG: hypothetical protein IPJ26_13765 [Bacteroidetes bacterium]|nr:hypothetical protein [Bacteroidota bacterium]
MPTTCQTATFWWNENKSVFGKKFCNTTELLLLDEPFSALDIAGKANCM